MKANTIIEMINGRMCDDVLADIYVDKDKLSYERKRYIEAIEQYITRFGDDDVWIYSAPGRSEIGGNHSMGRFWLHLLTMMLSLLQKN